MRIESVDEITLGGTRVVSQRLGGCNHDLIGIARAAAEKLPSRATRVYSLSAKMSFTSLASDSRLFRKVKRTTV